MRKNLLDTNLGISYRLTYALGLVVEQYARARNTLTTLSHAVGQAFKH